MGVSLKIHEGDELGGPRGDAPLLVPARRQPQCAAQEARPRAGMAADLDVVEHAHTVEQSDILERTADAELRDGMARQVEDRSALEQNIAVVGDVELR